jgi:hypothetical protein
VIPPRLRAEAEYRWRHGGHPLTRVGHRLLDVWLRRRIPLVVSRASGRELSIAYGGVAHGLTTLLPLLELRRTPVAGPTGSRTERITSWSSLSAGAPADVVAIGCGTGWPRNRSLRAALVLPYRVHLVVETAGGPAEVRRRIARRERELFSRGSRAHGWSLERDDSPAAFEHFYERMHVATMLRRHGERARSERPDLARLGILDRGCLLFVTESGTRVAGALCRWSERRRTLTVRLLGVLDGADEHYASGAFKALYHLLLDWAARGGVERVDLSGAEPLLSMGIVQWKRRLGAAMIMPPNHFRDKRVWFCVVRDTDAVRDFLVANPLLAMGPGESEAFEATYFYDGARPPRRDLPGDFPGVAGAREVDLDRFLDGLERAAAPPAPMGRKHG